MTGCSAWAARSLAGCSSRWGGGAGSPGPQHTWALFGAKSFQGATWTPAPTGSLAAVRPLPTALQGKRSLARARPLFIKQPQRSRRGESGLVDQFVIFLFCCGRNVRDANIKPPGKSPLQHSLVV